MSAALRTQRARDLAARPKSFEPLVMLTAYDAVSARIAHAAGVDLILVGDSAATTMLGYQYTREIQCDELLVLLRAARRGAPDALIVGDLPFGTYEHSDAEAVATALAFRKAGADLIKLEGAGAMLERVRAIVSAGIPVVGHVGLLPQSATAPGDLRARARTVEDALQVVRDALELEAAGCSAMVIEAVPSVVAHAVYQQLHVPLIGIGAGSAVGGQVLVFHDLLGLSTPPLPRFVREYAALGEEAVRAVRQFAGDVRSRAFPSEKEEYGMPVAERERFSHLLNTQAETPAG